MKKTILTTIAILIIGTAQAQQRVTRDAAGNYVSTGVKKDTARFTGHTYIDKKLKEWPVYISANDKLYYIKTSKSGTKYKVYIREN